MMDFHILTPAGEQLVMRTEEGRVVLVLPAPPESLPLSRQLDQFGKLTTGPAQSAPGK
jgi:hypothetical protein